MRAMPRAFRRPRILVTGALADPESRHPPDPAGTRGIARMARSYECGGRRGASVERAIRPTPATDHVHTVQSCGLLGWPSRK
ncbi:hypothetical protein [Luteimonas suaedae]|uniref:hypothetical protein n=1 Tax=Luteimonas suaedae TaxID=2605430 RepID=UPI0011EE891F|nr:hypothetical protein [Luteimonas suaedae]